jgi:4-amino-4-deoxy-L-arabinose transferase-like glycosyltransferase
MRVERTFPRAYLIFPLLGILVSLLFPSDRLLLRILVGAVIASLGVVAADARFHPSGLGNVRQRLVTFLKTYPNHRMSMLSARIAILFMVGAAAYFSPLSSTREDFSLPVLLTVLGSGALWLALWFARSQRAAPSSEDRPLVPSFSRMGVATGGVLLLLLTGERAGQALGISLLYSLDLRIQAIFFYGGIALLVMGISGIDRIQLPHLARPNLKWLTGEAALVIGLFCAALLVRAWNLQEGLRFSVDEALAIEHVRHYYGGAIGLTGRPSGYINTLIMPQWQGELMHLMGRSVASLRMVSTITGALTVVATYYLGRDLFQDRRTGLIAALVLLTFPPHVHFSKVALQHIADTLFGTLSIWFLIRGMRFNHRLDWALAGAALGMTQYFFEAGQLFFIALVSAWLIGAVLISAVMRITRKPQRPFPVRGLVIAVITFIFVASPMYYSIFSRGEEINPRLTVSGGGSIFLAPFQDGDGLTADEAAQLTRRILFPFTVYVHQPEIANFYGGDQPLLLVYVVPFFLIGCALLLWRWRSLSVILLLWVLFTALTNALLRDSAVYARWHVVFPAAALVTAIGLRQIVHLLLQSAQAGQTAEPDTNPPEAMPAELSGETSAVVPSRRGPWVEAGVLAALTLIIAAGQLHYYYAWHMPLAERQARESKPYPDGYDASMRALNLPMYTDLYLISDPIPDINVPKAWISFLIDSNEDTMRFFPLAAFDFTEAFIARLPADRNLALFIDSQASSAIARAVDTFGCAIQYTPYTIDPPHKAYVLCVVERENS